MNAWAHPTPHAKRQLDRSSHFHTTMQQNSHWLQWDAANSPTNCPFPFDDHHQNLIHPYRARPHSPPQTASISNQTCCHCSHVGTDRWEGRMFDCMSALLHRERHANNEYTYAHLYKFMQILYKFCKFLHNEPLQYQKLANEVGFELVFGKFTEITIR